MIQEPGALTVMRLSGTPPDCPCNSSLRGDRGLREALEARLCVHLDLQLNLGVAGWVRGGAGGGLKNQLVLLTGPRRGISCMLKDDNRTQLLSFRELPGNLAGFLLNLLKLSSVYTTCIWSQRSLEKMAQGLAVAEVGADQLRNEASIRAPCCWEAGSSGHVNLLSDGCQTIGLEQEFWAVGQRG